MSTKLQKVANRENAKKSTGPKTKEGKAESSQNATTHGLTAHYDVIRTESQEDFDLYRHEMIDEMDPIGPMQHRLAERIVSLSWRLRRAEQLHNQTIDAMLEYKGSDHDLALGHRATEDFANCRVLDKLIMYERRIENSLYKTMRELKKLKNEKTQNKPNYNQSQPKAETTAIYDIRNTQYENMQNEPNSKDKMNISEDIAKDYESKLHGLAPSVIQSIAPSVIQTERCEHRDLLKNHQAMPDS